ncbi:mannose-1-phosphate guanylyltransferase/mannose-6-phosphate isomerase [Falsirhodobacter halotolerans]|uniref:mannose-1-phosphate guanylyltransferase/mannose-6-phosphate isomerase n=1 Tax=Falsirhodobacter halotolerans TaxID=1146892 RepID=UPI001FD2E027|nr:mannose-1-phosphate guanylyltransferase/mannose-6-phosphate isomerase [Falsirhodobacter halotolerans]MCJ8140586.1 mannose-1-phosphate guanylyltransferase/mannose-6-phosphate isomerase [Falsirhodobacter halotolerans]
MTITPVLLCGGSGTRLWPLSRKRFPKQFTPLVETESPFQAAALRLSGPDYAAPMIVTAQDFRFIVTEQLAAVGVDPGAILIEPAARNTAPAILAAALAAPDAMLLVAPSDHFVPDGAAFRAAVDAGLPAARAGRIVTFGITPDRAETGYGWLEREGTGDGPAPLMRFVEKPDAARAEAMLADPRYLWNAGIFLARAATLIDAFRAHAPDLLPPVTAALDGARPDLGFLRLDGGAWAGVADISIDYAVMEQADNLTVVPFSAGWSDLGGWDAVWREGARDANGVALCGPATAIDCADTLLRSEAEGQEIVGIGLRDIVAVAMPDAVLVMDRRRAQEAKLAVTALRDRGAPQAEAFARDHRPWGWFETLALSDRFQVKRITVHPSAALSLQSHVHRSEHWIVVSGTARVTVDDTVTLVTENQSVYVPLGAKHRLENPGKVPMVLIEVQTGVYLGEDDITRYEDVYARG